MLYAERNDSTRKQLLELPNEVIELTLTHIAAHDIVSCSKTCRRLYQIVTGSSHLQLILELAVEGLRLRKYPPRCIPCGMDTKSAAERLVQFRQWKEAWIRQKPCRKLVMEIPYFRSVMKDGLYACLTRVRTLNSSQDSIKIYSLWMEEGQSELSLWKNHELDIQVNNFSLEPSENLLALVQRDPNGIHGESPMHVHLRTLNTALPHPNARTVILGNGDIPFWMGPDIKSCGDILAILSGAPGSHGNLLVWNWKTGEELYRCSKAYGYAYLSSSSIMTCMSRSSREARPGIFIEFIDIRAGSPELITLQLPTLCTRAMRVFSQAISVDSTNLYDDLPISPFIHDETAERVVILEAYWPTSIRIFILVRPLLQLLTRRQRTLSSSELKNSHLLWDEWKQGVAYATISDDDIPCYSIWGARAGIVYFRDVRSEDDSPNTMEPPRSRNLGQSSPAPLFLDFNPRPVIRALSRETPREYDDSLESRKLAENVSRKLFSDGMFPDKLRCFTITSEALHPHVLFDGNHIIMRKTSSVLEIQQFLY